MLLFGHKTYTVMALQRDMSKFWDKNLRYELATQDIYTIKDTQMVANNKRYK